MNRIASLLVTMLALAGVSAGQGVMTRGQLVLIGGGSKPAEAMTTFIALAGGQHAPIVVFPTASELPDTGDVYRNLFEGEYGCTAVAVAAVHERSDALDPVLAAQVAAAGGIWFAGGDQRRITAALLDTPVGEAVRAAFDRGAVVGGTSAGTACQSGLMITGDGDFSVIATGSVELSPGLGLFRGVIVDQHFVARARHNRLLSVVLEHPALLGVGIDEATAVWVRRDRSFKVLGEGWVVVYDASQAEVRHELADDGPAPLGVHGMVTHILRPGEVFDVATRSVVADAR